MYLIVHSYIYNCVTLFSHCLSKLCTCVIIDVTYSCFLIFSLVPLTKHLRYSKLNLRQKQTARWSRDLHLSDVILLAEFLKIKNIICWSSCAIAIFLVLAKHANQGAFVEYKTAEIEIRLKEWFNNLLRSVFEVNHIQERNNLVAWIG